MRTSVHLSLLSQYFNDQANRERAHRSSSRRVHISRMKRARVMQEGNEHKATHSDKQAEFISLPEMKKRRPEQMQEYRGSEKKNCRATARIQTKKGSESVTCS